MGIEFLRATSRLMREVTSGHARPVAGEALDANGCTRKQVCLLFSRALGGII